MNSLSERYKTYGSILRNMDMDYFVGVDVGTGSARAALVSSKGKIIKLATCPLEIFHPAPNFYEQSSDNIWSAVCHVIKV